MFSVKAFKGSLVYHLLFCLARELLLQASGVRKQKTAVRRVAAGFLLLADPETSSQEPLTRSLTPDA
ncbi:MAG: hypothetical protein PVI82_10280 [Desulfobacterales bacterium]|jgi:hypothetical protein